MIVIKLVKFNRKISIIKIGLLFIYSIISLYPLAYMLLYSLKTNEEIFYTNPFGIPASLQFENYFRALNNFNIIGFFRNSVIITTISVVAILILALPFSYAITRMHWKFREKIATYLTLGLFIPVQVIIIPLAILIKDLHLNDSYLALIIPYTAFNLSFTCMVLSNFFGALPKELEESAFMDGANIYTTFLKIMLPLVKPAIATCTIFAMLSVWNEYNLASVLATSNEIKTLPIGLASFVGQYSTDWGAMGASMVIASIPTIILYLVFSEQIENALTVSGAVKG